MQIKKILCLLLCLTMLVGMLAGCGGQETSDPGSNTPPVSDTPPDDEKTTEANQATIVKKYEATPIQSQEARYVPIAEVGTYNKNIVTDELVANVNLPEAGNGKAPVWNGYILENKIWVNFENEAWQKYTPGERYYNKFEIDRIAELGFNCVRIVYGLSYLSNPDDVYSINVSELEQLDELLSWCLENDLHLMISITGMPGKWNTSRQEEDVQANAEIFENPEMEKAYAAYMEMLAMRYADIPAKTLSFELLAEPRVPNDDVDLYAEVLEPVALAMWKHDSSKVLIINDVYGKVPERMAEIGCCLSLHNHVASVNSENLKMYHGIDMPRTYWPMSFVPAHMYDGQTVHLYSEEGFADASVSFGYTYFNFEPELYADGVLIPWENATGRYAVYDAGEVHAQIPDGTKKLEIVVREEVGPALIEVVQGGKSSKILPLDIKGERIDFEVEFTISPDGEPVAANEQTEQFGNWQYMYDSSISKFVECAEENGVSFIMTEVGTDTQSLSVEDYITYHTELLEILDEHNIGWMYNCIHNILAPTDIMWQGQAQGFTVTPIEGTPYFENREITDMLVSFAQQSQ